MTNGVLQLAIDAIYNQLVSHQAAGQKLETINHIMVGSRPLSLDNNEAPLILIKPTGGSIENTAAANYLGQDTLSLTLEISLVANNLYDSDTTKDTFANNTLYDDTLNGIIPLFENLIYCLTFNTGTPDTTTFNPSLGLPLQVKPNSNFTIEYNGNFVEIINSVIIEYNYSYTEIARS